MPVGEPLETPAASNLCAHPRTRGRAPPRGKQRRTRHRRTSPCNYASLLPCPSASRWKRRRHLTCVHPRTRWRATPRGKQRRTRHRRMTTVSSTSSFCRRRRRRRLIGRQTAGRGTTFGSGCAARRAASAPSYLAPSPPHQLHSSRAHSAPSVGRCRRARAVARLGSPSAALR